MRSVRQIVAVAAALVIAAAQVTGCTTGEDAVAQGGTFDFVSPGGHEDPGRVGDILLQEGGGQEAASCRKEKGGKD